jgi:hypothetical protein
LETLTTAKIPKPSVPAIISTESNIDNGIVERVITIKNQPDPPKTIETNDYGTCDVYILYIFDWKTITSDTWQLSDPLIGWTFGGSDYVGFRCYWRFQSDQDVTIATFYPGSSVTDMRVKTITVSKPRTHMSYFRVEAESDWIKVEKTTNPPDNSTQKNPTPTPLTLTIIATACIITIPLTILTHHRYRKRKTNPLPKPTPQATQLLNEA